MYKNEQSDPSGELSVGAPPLDGDVPTRSLPPFLILTFLMAWGFIALLVVMPAPLERVLGPPRSSHPFFVLAVWAPALVALALVRRTAGRGAVRRYLSRLLLWRAPAGWYAFLVLGIPALFFAGAALGGSLSGELEHSSPGALLQTMALMAVLGPVEELGWRGLALPLLQRWMAPLWAGGLLGLIWSVWHLPAFLLSGTPQGGWDFMPFFLGTTAVSVILTALFNRSRGSILIAALFHYQLINPLWPDAQPYDMYLFVGVAAAVAWLHRNSMLDRRAGVTDVVPPSRSSPTVTVPPTHSRSSQVRVPVASATHAGTL